MINKNIKYILYILYIFISFLIIDHKKIAGSFISEVQVGMILIDEKGNEHLFKIGNSINANVWVKSTDAVRITIHDNAVLKIEVV